MEDLSEKQLPNRFEKHDQLVGLQETILSWKQGDVIDDSVNQQRSRDLQNVEFIFQQYQEQAWLLDPYLEGLVTPVVSRLKEEISIWMASGSTEVPYHSTLTYFSSLLYQYIKCRGHKMIVRFFPHEVGDLTIVVDFMQRLEPVPGSWLWSLRYTMLLWLSLICMLPFDLAQFDEESGSGRTASLIEKIGKRGLGQSGLERDGASLLLSRLYARKDCPDRLKDFVAWAGQTIIEEHAFFPSIGAMQTLTEMMKTSPADVIVPHIPKVLDICRVVESDSTLMSNAVVRKLRVKLASRVGLRLLPLQPLFARRRGKALTSVQEEASVVASDDFDVPEDIEGILEDIFPAIQDRDTVVRWSAAKAVARIAERLPFEFSEQIVTNVLSLFEIHSADLESLDQMSATAESTWQGACLTSAEIARRGLVPNQELPTLVDWMLKAISFDIRKGAHSVGSSVRDAASYVLWSLARAYEPEALKPFSEALSRKLVTVSCFDREVHIRRAASATFQEHVGRTSLFADGIDILRKTDFFVVGVRRNAYMTSAPQVAEHDFYRPALLDQLLSVTLRHWDVSVRELGAQSLRYICEVDLPKLGPECAVRLRTLLNRADTTDIHGALLALTELATAFRDAANSEDLEPHRREIFSFLADIPVEIVQSTRNELVTAAACMLIAASISRAEIDMDMQSSVPHWRKVIDSGLKHRNSTVQEAAAAAMSRVSALVDCSIIVRRFINDFRSGSPSMQQSLARLLGVLDYSAYPHALREAITCLLESVDKTSRLRMSNVEARRNCMSSIPQIIANVASNLPSHITPDQSNALFNALISGLDDYTVDERGDVGSWVRMASLQGIVTYASTLFEHASSLPDLATYLPPDRFHIAAAGILKQGVERLDNVRQSAGDCTGRLLRAPLPNVQGSDRWRVHGDHLLRELFFTDSDTSGWQDSSWLFPRAVRLLEIREYWSSILSGLLLSVSSRTDSTQRPVSASLVNYVRGLPVSSADEGALDARSLVASLIAHARTNLASNNAVVPVLQLFNVLLEADALDALAEDDAGVETLTSLLNIASRGVDKLKNVQRILACMRTTINLLAIPRLYDSAVTRLPGFLAHAFPKVRADTAEYLYLLLQSRDLDRDTDEVEELLLETEWLSVDGKDIAEEIVSKLA